MTTGENEPQSETATATALDEAAETEQSSEAAVENEPQPETASALDKVVAKKKLDLDVNITDVGPCKKHIKVEIGRHEIDRQFEESFGTMKKEATVPGFRPGRAPRLLVEKRFRKQVAEQVKSNLLITALEQIDEDYKLNPITQPNLDIEAIKLPDEGPMRFEVEVEVRPDFALPDYKSLRIKKPTRNVSEDDIDNELKRLLERHARLVPKVEGGAELGDFITADLKFLSDGATLNEAKEIQFRLQPELRFQDGWVPNVAESLKGVKPGEVRETDAVIGSGSVDPKLRGKTIRVAFSVNDLKQLRLPELNQEFLETLGFENVEDLRNGFRSVLKNRFAASQRKAIRTDVLAQIAAKTPFELPVDLINRQEKSTIRRLVSKLKQEGLTEADIRAREADIRANAHESTLQSLKEFFLLAKIADAESIKVEDGDLNSEIDDIAERSGESPRRVRARIEKEGQADALASDILERKTLNRILEFVTFEEVPLVDEVEVETLDQTAGAVTEGAENGDATGTETAPQEEVAAETTAPAADA